MIGNLQLSQVAQQWPLQSAYQRARAPHPRPTLRARPSPPPGDTLCVAPEVSASGPPAEPAAGQAAPADVLTSPGEQPLRTGQLDTEGAKISGATRASCGTRDQPYPSGRAGVDSEQVRRQQEEEPDTDLRH